MNSTNNYIILVENTPPETLLLQASALDSLATLASSAGEAFVPIAGESLKLAGGLVTGEADPDIRRAALNLSCAVVSLPNAPQEMLAVVPGILNCLMETLKVRIVRNFLNDFRYNCTKDGLKI